MGAIRILIYVNPICVVCREKIMGIQSGKRPADEFWEPRKAERLRRIA